MPAVRYSNEVSRPYRRIGLTARPAADFEAALVRPSRSTWEAAVTARADVCSLGAAFWVNALPAAVFEAAPVDPLDRTFDADDAAFEPVVLVAILVSSRLFIKRLIYFEFYVRALLVPVHRSMYRVLGEEQIYATFGYNFVQTDENALIAAQNFLLLFDII